MYNRSKWAKCRSVNGKYSWCLKEFDLNINKMKSFVSNGASVMTGIHYRVAESLKRVNNVMLNFHCICHRLALACSGNETEHIKKVEEILT